MAAPISIPIRYTPRLRLTCPFRLPPLASLERPSRRTMHTTPPAHLERLRNTSNQTAADPADAPPRWARTPRAMAAPYKARPANDNDDYAVNEDPKRLDAVLGNMLGENAAGGVELDEEVKWLAVTHKSFDHGRRGMNDRLAFLGKRILELQTTIALIDNPRPSSNETTPRGGRPLPVPAPALAGIENATAPLKARVLDRGRLAQIATKYGIDGVIRWKPRQINKLRESGLDTVLSQTVYAIVGAVALKKGGLAAASLIRERILRPLGVI